MAARTIIFNIIVTIHLYVFCFKICINVSNIFHYYPACVFAVLLHSTFLLSGCSAGFGSVAVLT